MTRAAAPIAIAGPTATGKTVLAVELATRLGAELINADSRQVIRRLRVGTAAPTPEELRGVPCHLLDLVEPGTRFTVADWVREARRTLAGLDGRGVTAVVVGGTGQYLRALREGWRFAAAEHDTATRADLTARAATREGLGDLVAELRERDPDGAAAIDTANPRRVVAAVETLRSGAASLAAARARGGGLPMQLVVLDAEPDAHRLALSARMEAMFASGALVAEVEQELGRGTSADALRHAGIGYGEALDLLDGRVDAGAARAATLQRTTRYVKAQRTWFRGEPATLRLQRRGGETAGMLADRVLAELRRSGAGPPPGTRR